MKGRLPLVTALCAIGTLMLFAAPSRVAAQAAAHTKLTPEQVADVHGRLFDTGERNAIPDRLAKTTGDIYLYDHGPADQRVQLDPQNTLASWVRDSDLIVIGKVGAGLSHMTVGKGFLYTDWELTVVEVLKDNPKAPATVGSSITVSRPGGQLKFGERAVFAIRTELKDFRAGEEYLLFLKFVPATGAYTLCWPMGFTFSGVRAVPILKHRLNASEIELANKEKDSLVKSIRDTASLLAGNP